MGVMKRSSVAHLGTQLSCYTVGAGEPVVMIHGMGVGADGWAPQVHALGERYECLCFDNRGFGESQPRGVSLSVEQMADDVTALMDARGWQSAHLVGHSLGGLIALQFALTYRARVRSLALLCTFASGKIPTRLNAQIAWIGIRTRVGTRRMRRNAFLELVMPHRLLAESDSTQLADRIGTLFNHDLAESPPIVMQQFSATRRTDVTPRLPELAGLPTLVLSASEDMIAPPGAGEAIASGIPGARYVEISDASHGVTIQRVDEVNSLLLEHLDRAAALT